MTMVGSIGCFQLNAINSAIGLIQANNCFKHTTIWRKIHENYLIIRHWWSFFSRSQGNRMRRGSWKNAALCLKANFSFVLLSFIIIICLSCLPFDLPLSNRGLVCETAMFNRIQFCWNEKQKRNFQNEAFRQSRINHFGWARKSNFLCALLPEPAKLKRKRAPFKKWQKTVLYLSEKMGEKENQISEKKYADDDGNLTFIHHFAFMLLFFFQAYLFHHFGELAHSHWLLLENICFEKHKNEISKSTHIFYSGYTFRWHYWSESFVFVYWMRACVRLLSMCTRFSSANLSTL